MLRLTLLFCLCMVSPLYAEESLVEATDREMETLYDSLWAQADAENRAVLEKSQLAWQVYRLTHCAAYASRSAGESQCLAMLAEERTTALRHLGYLMEGEGEAEGCGEPVDNERTIVLF
jgi:hypothetical protein